MIIRASKIDRVEYNKDTRLITFTTFELLPLTVGSLGGVTDGAKPEFITFHVANGNHEQYDHICQQLFNDDEWIDTDEEE